MKNVEKLEKWKAEVHYISTGLDGTTRGSAALGITKRVAVQGLSRIEDGLAAIIAEMRGQEPVAWAKSRFIYDRDGRDIGTDEPELAWGKEPPEEIGWWPLYAAPPAPQQVDETRRKYEELLYAVARKFPNESRHETALRYIRQAEAPSDLSARSTPEKQP